MRLPKRVEVCGMEYAVIRVTRRTPKKLLPKEWSEETCGYFDADAGKIWVRAFPGHPTRERDSFVHELGHATLDGSGAGRFLGKDEDDEEHFMHTYTPALLATLKSAKVIR